MRHSTTVTNRSLQDAQSIPSATPPDSMFWSYGTLVLACYDRNVLRVLPNNYRTGTVPCFFVRYDRPMRVSRDDKRVLMSHCYTYCTLTALQRSATTKRTSTKDLVGYSIETNQQRTQNQNRFKKPKETIKHRTATTFGLNETQQKQQQQQQQPPLDFWIPSSRLPII